MLLRVSLLLVAVLFVSAVLTNANEVHFLSKEELSGAIIDQMISEGLKKTHSCLRRSGVNVLSGTVKKSRVSKYQFRLEPTSNICGFKEAVRVLTIVKSSALPVIFNLV